MDFNRRVRLTQKKNIHLTKRHMSQHCALCAAVLEEGDIDAFGKATGYTYNNNAGDDLGKVISAANKREMSYGGSVQAFTFFKDQVSSNTTVAVARCAFSSKGLSHSGPVLPMMQPSGRPA